MLLITIRKPAIWNRIVMTKITAMSTGKHTERLGIPFELFCRSCLDTNEKESLDNFL